ncbi:MAG: pyrroloquinoline quinone biosynthesis protein PqqB [Gemmatimonadota bacterium]
MKVRVLGSAAGGGLPQWNCACDNCSAARAGTGEVLPRSQSSIAVSVDGRRWLLVNASPDLRAQLEALPRAVGAGELRSSPLAAVLLTDAELDHTAGLLLLREDQRLTLACTEFVRDALIANGLWNTLAAYLRVDWRRLVPGEAFVPRSAIGEGLGLSIESFVVAGGPPLHWRGNGAEAQGHTIGVRFTDTRGDASGKAGLVYVPGAARIDADLVERIGPADTLLFDGTFWTAGELVDLGISERTAPDMGHLPVSGRGGSLERFRDVPAARKVFVHVNNTNPMLREGSLERSEAAAAGWEVAFDGMALEL